MIISGDHKTVAVCGPAIIEVNTAIADAIKRYLHIHQQLPANKNKSEKEILGRKLCQTDVRKACSTLAREHGIDKDLMAKALFHAPETAAKHYVHTKNNSLQRKLASLMLHKNVFLFNLKHYYVFSNLFCLDSFSRPKYSQSSLSRQVQFCRIHGPRR